VTEKFLKADAKGEARKATDPELAKSALMAENARLRIKLASAMAFLNQVTCQDAPRFDSRCMHCGKVHCAQAREFLEANQ
jgi:hypothetical protein